MKNIPSSKYKNPAPSMGYASSSPKAIRYPVVISTGMQEDTVNTILTTTIQCKDVRQAIKLRQAIKNLVKSYV